MLDTKATSGKDWVWGWDGGNDMYLQVVVFISDFIQKKIASNVMLIHRKIMCNLIDYINQWDKSQIILWTSMKA